MLYACVCVCVACDYSDDDMQSLASLMSLQQTEESSDRCDDVANMADVADEDDVQTCQPILTDIRHLVSRYPNKLSQFQGPRATKFLNLACVVIDIRRHLYQKRCKIGMFLSQTLTKSVAC